MERETREGKSSDLQVTKRHGKRALELYLQKLGFWEGKKNRVVRLWIGGTASKGISYFGFPKIVCFLLVMIYFLVINMCAPCEWNYCWGLSRACVCVSMGSTGEPDRKRRHFSSISPTAAAAAAAKKQPFWPSSEDKKVDLCTLSFITFLFLASFSAPNNWLVM